MRCYIAPTIEAEEIGVEKGIALSPDNSNVDDFPGGWDNDSEVELN